MSSAKCIYSFCSRHIHPTYYLLYSSIYYAHRAHHLQLLLLISNCIKIPSFLQGHTDIFVCEQGGALVTANWNVSRLTIVIWDTTIPIFSGYIWWTYFIGYPHPYYCVHLHTILCICRFLACMKHKPRIISSTIPFRHQLVSLVEVWLR